MSEILKYDVVVVGGGPAGTTAAIAAARSGASTLLVERLGFLGGMATAGMVIPHFEADRCGISLEIIERLKTIHGWGAKNWEVSYDPELWKIVSEEMVQEAGADILLHTMLADVELRGNHIQQVVLLSKGGEIRVHAKMYIDSTGDGDLAYLANVPFEKGRPSDGKMQPMTMMFRMDNVTFEQFDEYQLYNAIMEAKQRTGDTYQPPYDRPWVINLPEQGQVVSMFTHVYDVDGTNSWDLTKAEIEGRRQAFEAWQFLKRHVKGFERSRFVCTASHIGVRETRRFIGEYVLSKEDILHDNKFSDVIALSRFPIDIHEPDQGVQTNIPLTKAYEIPFRCLLPKSCQNLLLSGRNISGSYETFASYRVKGVAMALGQAAGTAAGLAIQKDIDVREISVKKLQTLLQEHNVNLGREGDQNTITYQNFPPGCELDHCIC